MTKEQHSRLIKLAAKILTDGPILSSCAEDLPKTMSAAVLAEWMVAQENRLKDYAYEIRQIVDSTAPATGTAPVPVRKD